MINALFRKEINKNYPKLNIVKLKKVKSAGMMNNIFIGGNCSNKYIIKIYKSNNAKKIISEHKLLHLINDLIPESISYISNKNFETYTFSNKFKKYFGIYKYIEGASPISLKNTSLSQIRKTAEALKRFQSLLLKMKNIDNDVIRRNIAAEFKNNINDLRKVFKILKNKKILNGKEKTVKTVLLKKLKRISEDDLNNLRFISQSSIGIIHGDFAPTNLVFNRNRVKGILDWENACIYNYAWETFRSICYCSNESPFGIICPKLNSKKVIVFLKSYFSKGNIFQKRDIEALKLMPKYYYFLDPYIITSYCLHGNKRASKLISTKINDHFWLENYYENFISLINKYANRKK